MKSEIHGDGPHNLGRLLGYICIYLSFRTRRVAPIAFYYAISLIILGIIHLLEPIHFDDVFTIIILCVIYILFPAALMMKSPQIWLRIPSRNNLDNYWHKNSWD